MRHCTGRWLPAASTVKQYRMSCWERWNAASAASFLRLQWSGWRIMVQATGLMKYVSSPGCWDLTPRSLSPLSQRNSNPSSTIADCFLSLPLCRYVPALMAVQRVFAQATAHSGACSGKHVWHWSQATPYCRATRETVIPGSKLYWTISIFSCVVRRLHFSGPKTSIICSPMTSF